MKSKLKFLILLLLSLTLLSLDQTLAKGGKNKKKSLGPYEKKLKNLREEYRKTKCSYLNDDLGLMCQNYYISPTCFRLAYGDQGLEWGETNQSKDNEFIDCFKKESTPTK
eukprot:403363151